MSPLRWHRTWKVFSKDRDETRDEARGARDEEKHLVFVSGNMLLSAGFILTKKSLLSQAFFNMKE
jgi:hypothetical protein